MTATNDFMFVQTKLVKDEAYARQETPKVESPGDAVRFFQDLTANMDREMVAMINVDVRGKVTNASVLSIGGATSAQFDLKQVFKVAILSNATSFILAHNHPSGDPSPSKEDISITERIAAAGQLMGIRMIDHIIVCEGSFYSFLNNNSPALSPDAVLRNDTSELLGAAEPQTAIRLS